MPETPGGKKAMAAMQKKYGADKGERVYYASRELGKVPEGAFKTKAPKRKK